MEGCLPNLRGVVRPTDYKEFNSNSISKKDEVKKVSRGGVGGGWNQVPYH